MWEAWVRILAPRPQSWNSVRTTGKSGLNFRENKLIWGKLKSCDEQVHCCRGWMWTILEEAPRLRNILDDASTLGESLKMSWRRLWNIFRGLQNILEESLMLIRRKPHFNHQSISFDKQRQHINTILINQKCLYFCCGHYCLSSSAENILHFR